MSDPTAARPRDADRTRLALLEAAQRLFSTRGYAATPVRDIAEEAGVNVALINRYFGSKEGLFLACLAATGKSPVKMLGQAEDLEALPPLLAAQIAGNPPEGVRTSLLLLLQGSGGRQTQQQRLDALRAFSSTLAQLPGTRDDLSDSELALRTQLLLCLLVGVATVKSQPGILPGLDDADVDALASPVDDVVRALLAPPL